MGMFDSVFVECPYCGIVLELQTKNGLCILGRYDLINAPPEVLLGVAGKHECDGFGARGEGCGKRLHVNVQCITKAWVEGIDSEGGDND